MSRLAFAAATTAVALALVLAAPVGAAVADSAAALTATTGAASTVAATVQAAPADPRAGAIGLLQLPEVYGTEPCQRFRPEPVPVFREPGGRASGEIRVVRPWTYPREGGCEGLRVEFVPADAAAAGTPAVAAKGKPGARSAKGELASPAGAAGELPAQEYAAEQPAAIVLEQRGEWFRLRLPAGSGWVRATPRNDYGPLLALLQRDLDGFTDPAGARLRHGPAPDAETVWHGVPVCAVPRVRATDTSGARTWLEVEFERDACCADDAPMTPASPVRGWLPLYRDDGVPSVWFASRGC
jgi:hypothetical protein